MTTDTTTRLVQAHNSINFIREYLEIGKFTEQSFASPALGSNQHMVRAAILKEFEAVAENLNFSPDDPIRAVTTVHPRFWQMVRKVYRMRNVIVHRYGVTDIEFDQVWHAITTTLEEEIVPAVEALLEAKEGEEGEGEGEAEEHKEEGGKDMVAP